MSFSAIIFDMDGLLVDSEPLWYEVEVAMIEQHGYTYTDDVRDSTVGLRVDEFAQIIHKHYPKVADTPANVAKLITHKMMSIPAEKITPRPGAEEIIRYAAEKKIPRAIASSSSQRIIDHFVTMLGWGELIPLRFSAEFMRHGKPEPDIYLHAAKSLSIAPEKCIALEDSKAGTQAALSAGMTCYTVPDLSHSNMSDFERLNDNVFDNLHDVLDTIKAKGFFE